MLRYLPRNNFEMYVLVMSKLKYETWCINNALMRHPYLRMMECEESRLISTRLTFFHAHGDGNMQTIPIFKFVD